MSKYSSFHNKCSVVKMLCWMCSKSNSSPNKRQVEHAVRRNFGGYTLEMRKDAAEIFLEQIQPSLLTAMPTKSEMKVKLKNNFRDEFKNDPVKRDQLYASFFALWHERVRSSLQESVIHEVDDEQLQQYCSVIFRQMWSEGRFDYGFQEEYEKQYTSFFQEKFEKEVKAIIF